MPLDPGDPAPSFRLTDIATGDVVTRPWEHEPVALVFFKVTCPVCQMVAPKVQALADGGARVVAIGQDPPEKLEAYRERWGQRVPTLSESPPYLVSNAYRITSVPTIFLVGTDGNVQDTVAAWDRTGWNAVATALGAPPVSVEGDGLPSYRPG
ncbi:MAG: TlpA family protein disulfide reductase [Acidimicrobiia bacterium]